MNDLTKKRVMSVATVIGIAALTTVGVMFFTNKTKIGSTVKKVTG